MPARDYLATEGHLHVSVSITLLVVTLFQLSNECSHRSADGGDQNYCCQHQLVSGHLQFRGMDGLSCGVEMITTGRNIRMVA